MSASTETIRNGQAIRLNILSGESVAVAAVTGTYNASIVQGAGIGVIATAATRATYGPYPSGIVILLTASAASEIDYAIGVTPVIMSDTFAKIYAADTAAESYGASPTATAAANTTAIQAALTVGGSVSITVPGVYLINATLTIPSNTNFNIGAGVTIKLADGLSIARIIQNVDMTVGNSNIAITGKGTLDANSTNINLSGLVSDVRLMAMRFTRVTGLIVDGISIINTIKYAVHITATTKFRTSNLTFSSSGVGADGVHVHGQCSEGLIENIYGTTGDDVVVLNVRDVGNWLDPITGGTGFIKNILIRNITGATIAANSGSPVALYGNTTGVTTAVSGATWASGIATVTATGFVGVVGSFITVAGITASVSNGYNGTFRVKSIAANTVSYVVSISPGTYTSGGTVDNCYDMAGIVVENVKSASGGTSAALNIISSPTGTTGVIGSLKVSDVRMTATGTNTPRQVYIGMPFGEIILDNIVTPLAGGTANGELLFTEASAMGESLIINNCSSEQYFVGTLGGVIKIQASVKSIVSNNCNFRLGPSNAAFYISTSTAYFPFEALTINNLIAQGLLTAYGGSAFEIGVGTFSAVNVSNITIKTLIYGIKTNAGTGNFNLNLNNIYAESLGDAIFRLYGTACTAQIAINGFTPGGSGGWFVINNDVAGGSVVTQLKMVGFNDYTLPVNFMGSSTPGAGATLRLSGAEIKVDISKVSRVDGAILNNTNAALGTLAVAGLVSCEGTAANSWSRMSIPTLKY